MHTDPRNALRFVRQLQNMLWDLMDDAVPDEMPPGHCTASVRVSVFHMIPVRKSFTVGDIHQFKGASAHVVQSIKDATQLALDTAAPPAPPTPAPPPPAFWSLDQDGDEVVLRSDACAALLGVEALPSKARQLLCSMLAEARFAVDVKNVTSAYAQVEVLMPNWFPGMIHNLHPTIERITLLPPTLHHGITVGGSTAAMGRVETALGFRSSLAAGHAGNLTEGVAIELLSATMLTLSLAMDCPDDRCALLRFAPGGRVGRHRALAASTSSAGTVEMGAELQGHQANILTNLLGARKSMSMAMAYELWNIR